MVVVAAAGLAGGVGGTSVRLLLLELLLLEVVVALALGLEGGAAPSAA